MPLEISVGEPRRGCRSYWKSPHGWLVTPEAQACAFRKPPEGQSPATARLGTVHTGEPGWPGVPRSAKKVTPQAGAAGKKRLLVGRSRWGASNVPATPDTPHLGLSQRPD